MTATAPNRPALSGTTFGWFGAEIRSAPDLTPARVAELARTCVDDQQTKVSTLAVRCVLGEVIHPADLDTFWNLARAHRQTMDDLARLLAHLVAELAPANRRERRRLRKVVV